MKLQVEVLMAFVLCAVILPITGGSKGNGIFPSPKLSPIVPSDGPQAAIPAYPNQPKLNPPTPAIISPDISPSVLSPNVAPPPIAQIIAPQASSPSIQLISPSMPPSSVPVKVSSKASPLSPEIPSPSTPPVAADVPPSSSFSPSSLPHTGKGITNGTLPGSDAPLSASAAPVSSPPIEMPAKPPTGNPNISGPPPMAHSNILGPPPSLNGPEIPPTVSFSPRIHGYVNTAPAAARAAAPAAAPTAAPSEDSPSHHLSPKRLVPASSPKPNDNLNYIAPSPLITYSHTQKGTKDQPPASSPTSLHRHISRGSSSPSPLPGHQEPAISSLTSPSPKAMMRNQSINHASPPLRVSLSPAQSPHSSVHSREALAPAPVESPNGSYGPVHPPLVSIPGLSPMSPRSKRHYHFSAPVSAPTGSFDAGPESPKGLLPQALSPPPTPMPLPARALPPPPPNMDCASWVCTDPFTNSPPGSPCACVRPMKIGLRLNIALYTFFPLVPELALEIAFGTFMKQSQVRIMGASAATEQPQKTVVLIDLVPRGQMFDNTTAYLTSEKFWHKQVGIKATYFGDYDVLYVSYPGLPPSPPMPPGSINVDDGSNSDENNSRTLHPLGVDVGKRKAKFSGSLIVIVILSSIIALVLCVGTAWIFLLKHSDHVHHPVQTPRHLLPFFSKATVTGPAVSGSAPSSVTGSFSSSMAAYTGSAKTFSAGEIERATNKFEESRIIGEGGFGRVYNGTLEDGTNVAVKVLKRDDQQGSREFLAEVEMLSRLHHRNLVKLLGICTEEHLRCLVYELIPNGSVESHLHGADKDIAPLDWSVRMKIALGSARGLAYLHEDSSPRVIHRDFKSSNILLESDFTPKVSDFGLARTALEEGNEHISTRVMGTFGYVAPEYAMTGHLLVKSDVYSYGVVLLELLTGRKPVDMLQPPGQENLVTWARPLLTSKEGLEIIIDPALGPDFPFESMAKVAAIASMCVQPEVSHRPFMGEVVQALKLVCNENDEHIASGSCSQDDSFVKDPEARISTLLVTKTNDERVLSVSEIFSTSEKLADDASGSFRRHSSSGPLRPSRSGQFWKKTEEFVEGKHELAWSRT